MRTAGTGEGWRQDPMRTQSPIGTISISLPSETAWRNKITVPAVIRDHK